MKNPLSWIKLKALGRFQEKLIFKPDHHKVDPMRHPESYGLAGVIPVDIHTKDHVTLHLWQKLPEDETKPLFIIFHGNTGHFGDVGKPTAGEEYDPQYRIALLKAILESGAGLLAVSLRGYGLSHRTEPSEEGFIRDVDAVIDYVQKDMQIAHHRVILLGESLGAAVAMIAAEDMTLRNTPPAVVTTIAAFSSMKAKALEIHPDLDHGALESALRHRFNSEERLTKMRKDTHFYLTHPADDETTGKEHTKRLAALASEYGLTLTHEEIPGGHITWNPRIILDNILKLYGNA